MKKATLLLIASFIFVPLSYAADVHVNGSTGSDYGDCGTVSAPCRTVARGVTKAGSGTNVVKVAVGNYSEKILIDSPIAGLTLQGGWNADFTYQICNPNLTVWDPGNKTNVMEIDADATENITVNVSCLTVKGTDDTHRSGMYFSADGGTLTISINQSIFDGFTVNGIYLNSRLGGSIDMTIHKSTFKNLRQPKTATTTGGGIHSQTLSGSQQTIVLDNCLLFNNEAREGPALNAFINGLGSSTDLSLTNVTISDNRSNSSLGAMYLQSVNYGQITMDVANTIAYHNSNGYFFADIYLFQVSPASTTVNAHHSIIQFIHQDPYYPGTYNDNGYNLNVNPRLDSSYHLKAGSPAIDAAQCGTLFTWPLPPYHSIYWRVAPYDDIDGDSRPGYGKLTGCDIGADEWYPKAMPWLMLLLE